MGTKRKDSEVEAKRWETKGKKYDFSKKVDLDIDIVDRMYNTIREAVSKYDDARKWMYQPSIDFVDRIHDAAEHPDEVVWHSFTTPPEIIYAVGLKPLCIEYLSLVCGPWFGDYFFGYVDDSHAAYLPEHICSYSKGTIGMALHNVLPKPVALIHTSQPCDNGIAANQAIVDLYGIKGFCLDVPYDDTEESHRYFAEQVKEGLSYLEHQTGKKLDIDRYREVMERSHRAHDLLKNINDLKKRKPCPLPSGAVMRQTVLAMCTGGGSEETVRFLEKHLEDAKERAIKGIGVPGVEEKIRTSWIFTFVSYDFTLFDWMEETYGAIPVAYQGSHYFYRPRRDLSSFDKLNRALGDRTLAAPMGRQNRGHLDDYVRDCVHWARDWSCDASIFVGHIACKAGWAVAQIIKETLIDELNHPLLIFECDSLDPRVEPLERIRRKLEPFFDSVVESKESA